MVHAVKTYMGFRVVDPLILNLTFKPRPPYLQENLVSLKFVLGRLETTIFLLLPGLERRFIHLVE